MVLPSDAAREAAYDDAIRTARPGRRVHLAAEVQAHAGDRLGYRRAALVLANTRAAEEALLTLGYPVQTIPPCIGLPAGAAPARSRRPPPHRVLRQQPDHAAEGAAPAARRSAYAARGAAAAHARRRLERAVAPAVERVERAGTEVVVLGRVPRERYLDLLAREADLLAMPSLYEEWGYALFEALSRGVPALALRRYPFADLLDPRMGVLADDATPEAVAAALEQALTGELPDADTVRSATAALVGADVIAPRLLAAYERVAS